MSVATASPRPVRYRSLFPAWEGPRPVSWYFIEQLLEARATSDFPTNAAGEDEDVNVYLADRLAAWATGDGRGGIMPGRDPLLRLADPAAPASLTAWTAARQADHRLLGLGLFDRGDLVRRRVCGWRMTMAETRRRDREVAVRGYQFAADRLAGRAGDRPGTVAVWRKLARNLDGYVHVLQTLARRRLGLGARLEDADLAWLLRDPGTGAD